MKVFAWICAGLMALAVIPAYADSGCSEKHENVSRFNPTELSDYQKCVFKWKGQEIGTVGNYIWMQHNNDFIYIPIANLAGKSKDDTTEIVIEEMIKAQFATQIASLEEQIRILKEVDLKGKDDLIENLQQQLKDANRSYAYASAAAAKIASGNYDEVAESVASNNNPLRDAETGISITITNGDHSYVITNIDSSETIAKKLNGSRGRAADVQTAIAEIMDLVQSEVEKAYDAGYADGYADGYAQGFADGRAIND